MLNVLGKRIKMLRKSKSMTQSQLAEALGVSQSTIGMYECNSREPDLKRIMALARLFDVPVSALIEEEYVQVPSAKAKLDAYSFGMAVYRLRKGRGLSQDQLADMLGISKQAVSNYERGIREPDFNMLEDLASTFGMTVPELFAAAMNSDDPAGTALEPISPEEHGMILAWRSADARAREDAMSILLAHTESAK